MILPSVTIKSDDYELILIEIIGVVEIINPISLLNLLQSETFTFTGTESGILKSVVKVLDFHNILT